MKILCVDTATHHNWVGLYVDNQLIGSIGYQDRQSCLINLIPSIQTLLKNAQTDIASIDALCTVVGPGAWSSLRIGISTVKQLALVNQLPIVTMSSLDVIIEMAVREGIPAHHMLAVMDAQNGKVYAALYAVRGGVKKQISPYQWEDVSKVAANIPSDVNDLWIVGDGAPSFVGYLRNNWQIRRLIPQADSRYLQILGEIASSQQPIYQHEEALLLKPLYIQPSSAEVEFKVSVT